MKIIKNNYNQPGEWEVVIPFNQEGIEQEFLGVIDGRSAGKYVLTVIAQHEAPRTRGRITVRAVCGAKAVVQIKGIIRIGKEAQETDDFLELRVLTLAPSSQAVAEPELEIEANNVKASHAASVGPIDPIQMRYLKSRGLSNEEAQNQILGGWLEV